MQCSTLLLEDTHPLSQRTLTYFVRGSITVQLTSYDSAALLVLIQLEVYKFGRIQTSQKGGQLYSDTSPYKGSECSLPRPTPDWANIIFQTNLDGLAYLYIACAYMISIEISFHSLDLASRLPHLPTYLPTYVPHLPTAQRLDTC